MSMFTTQRSQRVSGSIVARTAHVARTWVHCHCVAGGPRHRPWYHTPATLVRPAEAAGQLMWAVGGWVAWPKAYTGGSNLQKLGRRWSMWKHNQGPPCRVIQPASRAWPQTGLQAGKRARPCGDTMGVGQSVGC
ncbi:hypothetical protein HaLaN_30696 [Haematococcus lacustris]|uniref:Uncharacterized protein n=1 Tax=Haematococcus lacustris TaxID=44745 RepID=A0A6A0AFE4_HAELA|nr:hypothetical protein HaLaN_30696 [Haematococcus lacustris]